MEDRRFAIRLLVVLFTIVVVGFTLEVAWDLSRAIDPVTGKPVALADIGTVTPAMARSVASPLARAFNNILALLLTFIGLAIPLTANLYTPKLIQIFVR